MIKLGSRVKDNITGLMGYMDHYSEYMHSARRIGITPGLKPDGTTMDGIAADEANVELVPGVPPIKSMPEPPRVHEFGQEVEDEITGFKGKVTGRAVYINGCARCWVEPRVVKGEMKEGQWINEGRLKAIGKKISKPKAAVRTGGPQPSSFRKDSARW
jgi:hypothetical protein